MKCPFCGNYIENTLYLALAPYRERSAVVITNIDYIVEVGNRIVAVIEEKHSPKKIIRGYQLVTLKKVAKALNVPLYILFSGNGIELYEFDTNEIVRSNPYVSFDDHEPVFSGTLPDFGYWFYRKFLAHAPPSKKVRCSGRD